MVRLTLCAALVLALCTLGATAASVRGPAHIVAADLSADEARPSLLAAALSVEEKPMRFVAAQLTADAAAPGSSASPTNFIVNTVPRPGAEVVFNACGKPLCPPATVYGAPPAGYQCDCTEVIPHPDCVPICRAKAGAPSPYMPYKTCKCPYQMSLKQCPCGGPTAIVGEGFPIVEATNLAVPQKPAEAPFTQAVEPPNPLPPVSDSQCRPNIARHGPGNCRTQPKSADCSTPGSNCVSNTNPGPAGAPTRELSCECKYEAPAPCRCVNVTGSKALVDDAEGLVGKPGSLVDAFARKIADKVLAAIAPQLTSVAAANSVSASLAGSQATGALASGSATATFPAVPATSESSASLVPVGCTSQDDCNKKFDALVKSGDPAREKGLLQSEGKHLKALAKEYTRMAKRLQKKIDRQMSKYGKANPSLQKALNRIKRQNKRLREALKSSEKAADQVVKT